MPPMAGNRAMVALAGLAVVFPVALWRQRRKVLRALMLVCAATLVSLALGSCAGAGGTSGSGGNGYGGGKTAPGSYPVVMQASAGGVSHSITLKLVVN
jgi:hypothetical protein